MHQSCRNGTGPRSSHPLADDNQNTPSRKRILQWMSSPCATLWTAAGTAYMLRHHLRWTDCCSGRGDKGKQSQSGTRSRGHTVSSSPCLEAAPCCHTSQVCNFEVPTIPECNRCRLDCDTKEQCTLCKQIAGYCGSGAGPKQVSMTFDLDLSLSQPGSVTVPSLLLNIPPPEGNLTNGIAIPWLCSDGGARTKVAARTVP